MQTSRFQLGLIATLAVGLGFSLSSSEAVGYPAGAAVSLGANPVWAEAGFVSSVTSTLLTAPSDQVVVVTDLLLSMKSSSCASTIKVETSDGELLAAAKLHSYFYNGGGSTWGEATNSAPTTIQHSFVSGLPLPAGQALEIQESGGCNVAYTLSGYYAQP